MVRLCCRAFADHIDFDVDYLTFVVDFLVHATMSTPPGSFGIASRAESAY